MYLTLAGAVDVSFERHGCMQMHSTGQVALRMKLKPACHDSHCMDGPDQNSCSAAQLNWVLNAVELPDPCKVRAYLAVDIRHVRKGHGKLAVRRSQAVAM